MLDQIKLTKERGVPIYMIKLEKTCAYKDYKIGKHLHVQRIGYGLSVHVRSIQGVGITAIVVLPLRIVSLGHRGW